MITGLTLPGMIDDPGCVSGQRELRDAGPRAHAHQAQVAGDLPEAQGDGPDRAVGGDRRVERRLGVEVVVVSRTVEPGQRREPGAGAERVLGMRVDPGPDRRPAERHRQQLRLRRPGAAEWPPRPGPA